MFSPIVQEIIAQSGGIHFVLGTISAHPTQPDVLAAACASLMNMAFNDDNAAAIVSKGGFDILKSAAEACPNHLVVQDAKKFRIIPTEEEIDRYIAVIQKQHGISLDEVKQIFDPRGILNPGKKTGGTIDDIKKSMITHV